MPTHSLKTKIFS